MQLPHLSSRQGTPGNEAEITARRSVPIATEGDRSPPWAALSRQDARLKPLVRNWIVSPAPIPASGSNELIPLHCAGIGEKFTTRLTC